MADTPCPLLCRPGVTFRRVTRSNSAAFENQPLLLPRREVLRSSIAGRAICTLLACASLICSASKIDAATTGTISGTVVDAATKAPIAGARVTAASPSQVGRVTADSAGRFTFLSLAPDTYTISAEHAGYEPVSIAGIAVFADQSQIVTIALPK